MRVLAVITAIAALALPARVCSAEPIQIVAFGGSNTFGKNVARSEAYPAQLEALLRSEKIDVAVRNEGTSGQSTADEARKVDAAVPDGTRIVIFQPGGNDRLAKHGQPVASTNANIAAIVRRLLARKILVLFSGSDRKKEVVRQFDVLTIDEINSLAPGELQPDGSHLTPEGYRMVAEKMLPLVNKLICSLPEQRRAGCT